MHIYFFLNTSSDWTLCSLLLSSKISSSVSLTVPPVEAHGKAKAQILAGFECIDAFVSCTVLGDETAQTMPLA